MKMKKVLVALLLTLALMLSILPAGAVTPTVKAPASDGRTLYFYDQLEDETAKGFYNAMYTMYETDMFKSGNENYDLVENEIVTQEQLKEYASGSQQLLNQMGAARDAFYMDFADVFYVDFSYLSIRVTLDSNEQYHAYLGTGRGDTYFTEGFDSKQDVELAVTEYDKKLQEAVDAIKLAAGDDATQRELVSEAHQYIITHNTYKLEDACDPANVGFIRTAYGSIVTGESVCEGYSRGLKVILDKLSIPCILVNGVYRHDENVPELHMWNYVKLDDDKWYAIDATMDDPINSKGDSEGGVDGYENDEYLLVGEDVMSVHHVPNGNVSPVNFEFKYPQLVINKAELAHRVNPSSDLTVTIENVRNQGEWVPAYIVSYKGMNYEQAAKQGKYIIANLYQASASNEDEYLSTGWTYADLSLAQITPRDDACVFPASHVQYAEFAVTNIAPRNFYYNGVEIGMDYHYYGDPLMFEASTDKIVNDRADYVAPPYVKSSTIPQNMRITIGQTYDVVIEYDQPLEKIDENAEVGYNLEVEPDSSHTAIEKSKIEEFKYDGDRKISFKFTPSVMFADDTTLYKFNFTNLRGKISKKVPNEVQYMASFPCAVCAYRFQGIDWNIFGKPALLENKDLSTEGWTTNDGESVADQLKHRMVLVATQTSGTQAQEMGEMIAEQNPEQQVLHSETYSINLTVCKKQVIKTGQGVRVSLGFPEGYGPDDEGVTFKAYHFTKNDAGELVSVEEIECVVTKYGLIVVCDAFSPFSIVAVKSDEKEEEQKQANKTVILSSTPGGEITGDSSIMTLSQHQYESVNIKAHEGYVIESLTVGGKDIPVTGDRKTMDYELRYEDLEERESVVEANFVAESVQQAESDKGESVVQNVITPAEITLDSEMTVDKYGPLTIAPKVADEDDVASYSYQWYKDGVQMPDQKSKELSLDYTENGDAGTYKIEVKKTVGEITTPSFASCAVSINEVPEFTSSAKLDTTLEITNYISREGNAVVPEMIDGKKVTSIAANAVKDNQYIQSVTVSETVKEIGSGAFSGCTQLKSAVIPPSVKTIGSGAFTGCDNITIYGIKGSEAETYAGANNLTFVAVPVGDVNNDGHISVADAILVQKHIVEVSPLSGTDYIAADADYDSKITISDAITIQKVVVGINTSDLEP